jgi:hypothetical protein
VGSALEAIKKKGFFKAHKDANKAYLEQCKSKQAKAHLSKLDGSTNRGQDLPKKSVAVASQADPALQAEHLSDVKQAQEATEKAKAKGEQAAADMFQLFANLLSIDAKDAWNKIVHKQTASDPYTDLQAVPRKDPGDFCASHLMTA